MDPWLTDGIKEQIFAPCLTAAALIGLRLEDRLKRDESIDERALTADLIDSLDTASATNSWGLIPERLRDDGIFLSTVVKRARNEPKNGADIGIVVQRHIIRQNFRSSARYAALVQCKKVDSGGTIQDFFHETNGRKQSEMMLDITPSSFYVIFVAPSQVPRYTNIEPVSFIGPFNGCSSPVGNMGLFGYHRSIEQFQTRREWASFAGVLVMPALAVKAQGNTGTAISLDTLLPNCIPLWYWFGQLLIPAFIGDDRSDVIAVATRTDIPDQFSVNYSLELSVGTG